MNDDVVLRVDDLSIVYRTKRGNVQATTDISFDLKRGEAMALIGESGSGKTTVSLSLIRKLPKNALVTKGQVLYQREGNVRDVLKLSKRQLREFRWKDCAMVFQGSQNAFNPVLKIRKQFEDTARAHGWTDKEAVRQRALELLRLVRLDPERVYEAYPHELSGGMKQRTLLALGVLLNPQVVILDEPTTALDILTQRAIIDVLNDMQKKLNFSIIFISHDLSLAAEMADIVATVYAGEIVEIGPVNDIFYDPQHPYTHGLLTSVPKLDHEQDLLTSIKGAPPNLITPPSGCKFHPRCPYVTEKCSVDGPPLAGDKPEHLAACWHKDALLKAREELAQEVAQ
ncbi:MAG: ABC transporter ATP-binding protein [Anaerolineae bacterium]|nr:ABC transporter ATP-binding protein [Anaerolineae bacterium]MCA9887916.1 ABC transporter ATP-binding protein [Anaerolineae bacterium]MCA9892457.1 ABC transporter ATP-binding protein [Anaerolineae bacterium]MCB9460369.1 ABC transporter ATP-binding protein [Anaerolineaceae bacterium]